MAPDDVAPDNLGEGQSDMALASDGGGGDLPEEVPLSSVCTEAATFGAVSEKKRASEGGEEPPLKLFRNNYNHNFRKSEIIIVNWNPSGLAEKELATIIANCTMEYNWDMFFIQEFDSSTEFQTIDLGYSRFFAFSWH